MTKKDAASNEIEIQLLSIQSEPRHEPQSKPKKSGAGSKRLGLMPMTKATQVAAYDLHIDAAKSSGCDFIASIRLH